MKKITLLTLMVVVFQIAYTQVLIKRDTIYPVEEKPKEETKTKPKKENKPQVITLFQGQKSFGGYFGLTMGYTSIDNQEAFSAGSRFMFVANHYIGIGFGGKGFMTMPETYYDSEDYFSSTYVANVGGYGGFYIEPVIYSLKPIHASLPILLGAGGIVNEFRSSTDETANFSSSSAFFIVEPGIDLEFNIAKWFRLGVGTSYRFTTKLETLENKPDDLLKGFNYNLSFKFGWF